MEGPEFSSRRTDLGWEVYESFARLSPNALAGGPSEQERLERVHKLARLIDQTLLRPEATPAEIDAFAAAARRYPYAALCVQPVFVERVRRALVGTPIQTAVVVGFPHGALPASLKAAEARALAEAGAQEFDMVIHVGSLLAGDDDEIRREVEAVVQAVAPRPVKVILECAYLNREAMIRGAAAAVEAGAAFVKTSTGFGPGGARVEDVRLLREVVGTRAGVKAAGGIRNLASALAMLRAGADRIGTSHGESILEEALRADQAAGGF